MEKLKNSNTIYNFYSMKFKKKQILCFNINVIFIKIMFRMYYSSYKYLNQ